jgi:Predicted O-methyltransferase
VGQRVIDVGCGAGAVMLSLHARHVGLRLTGLERDPMMAELARANVARNGAQAAVIQGDVGDGFRVLGLHRFDWAMSNPPFFDDPGALRVPAPAKQGAWMADDGLKAWTDFLLAATRDGGGVAMIHRADRLADILALLGNKAGSFVVTPIHSYADQPAKRVVVRAVRGGRAPLKLMPPLVLHDRSDAKHTAQAEAILRGEVGLV